MDEAAEWLRFAATNDGQAIRGAWRKDLQKYAIVRPRDRRKRRRGHKDAPRGARRPRVDAAGQERHLGASAALGLPAQPGHLPVRRRSVRGRPELCHLRAREQAVPDFCAALVEESGDAASSDQNDDRERPILDRPADAALLLPWIRKR